MAKQAHQTSDQADIYLQRLFAGAPREIADAGFAARVMAAVVRRERLRVGVFTVALALGAGIIISQLPSALNELLVLLPERMPRARIPVMTPTILAVFGAALAAILTPLVTRMLED